MPLHVECIVAGTYVCQQKLDWLPGPAMECLRIEIKPTHSVESAASLWKRDPRKRGWITINAPRPQDVRPYIQWKSDSNTSEARYPYWWNLCESFSNCAWDIVLQLLVGPCKTSHHYHRITGEEYFSIYNDGHTYLRRDDSAPVLLTNIECIPKYQPHSLFREQAGFSLQLLRMQGPIRFPRRDDHVSYHTPPFAQQQ